MVCLSQVSILLGLKYGSYLYLLSANVGPTQRAQNKRSWGLITLPVSQPD